MRQNQKKKKNSKIDDTKPSNQSMVHINVVDTIDLQKDQVSPPGRTNKAVKLYYKDKMLELAQKINYNVKSTIFRKQIDDKRFVHPINVSQTALQSNKDISDILNDDDIDRYLLSSTDLIKDLINDKEEMINQIKSLDETLMHLQNIKNTFNDLITQHTQHTYLGKEKIKKIVTKTIVKKKIVKPLAQELTNDFTLNEKTQIHDKHDVYFQCNRNNKEYKLCLCKKFVCINGKKKHLSGKTNVYIDKLIINTTSINIRQYIKYKLSVKLLAIIARCYFIHT